MEYIVVALAIAIIYFAVFGIPNVHKAIEKLPALVTPGPIDVIAASEAIRSRPSCSFLLPDEPAEGNDVQPYNKPGLI